MRSSSSCVDRLRYEGARLSVIVYGFNCLSPRTHLPGSGKTTWNLERVQRCSLTLNSCNIMVDLIHEAFSERFLPR